VSCLHHLSAAKAERAKPRVDLDPEQQPVRRAHLAPPPSKVFELHRCRSAAVHKRASPQQLHQVQTKRVVLRTFLSGVGLERWKVDGGGRHRQPVPVRVSVAAAQRKDNRATVSLARHLAVQAPARREAEKSVGNLPNLQPRRLPVRVRAKPKADEREGKGPMVNLPASQKAERQLRLSKGRGNRSAERRRAKGLHRRGHNNLLLVFEAAPEQNSGAALFKSRFVGRLYQTPGKFAIKPVAFHRNALQTFVASRGDSRFVGYSSSAKPF
jgi:hypothetical protein